MHWSNASKNLHLDVDRYNNMSQSLREGQQDLQRFRQSTLVVFPETTTGDMSEGKWAELSDSSLHEILQTHKKLSHESYEKRFVNEFAEYRKKKNQLDQLNWRVRIWERIKTCRSNNSSVQLLDIIQYFLEEEENSEQRLLLLRTCIDELWQFEDLSGSTTPPALTDFIARFAAVHDGDSVLDPVCGSGLLLATVTSKKAASVSHGVDINPKLLEIAKELLEKAIFVESDIIETNGQLNTSYDLIVADSTNMLFSYEKPIVIDGFSKQENPKFADLLAFWASQRLSEKGTALFVTEACFHSDENRRKIWDSLKNSGIYVRACINLPAGTFHSQFKHSYLVIVDRVKRESIFTAEYSKDKDRQEKIIRNYKSDRLKCPLAEGRLLPWRDFFGFSQIEARDKAKKIARKRGLKPVELSLISIGFEEVSTGVADKSKLKPNSIYFSKCGSNLVESSIENLPVNSKICIQVQLNDKKVDASYAAMFLNSDLGKIVMTTISSEGEETFLEMERLKSLVLYIPEIKRQKIAKNILREIFELREELKSLEHSTFENPQKLEEYEERIQMLNKEDKYEDWMETLPFPLASILWIHHVREDPKEKFDALLHFFEALSQFTATILISAIKQDSSWPEILIKLNRALSKAGQSFELSSFGTWKTTCEVLAGHLRTLPEEKLSEILKTHNQRVINTLSSKSLENLLKDIVLLRNDLKGHSGLVNSHAIEGHHDELEGFLSQYRALTGDSWQSYQLVRSKKLRFDQEGFFDVTVDLMMGTRRLFKSEQRKCDMPLVDGHDHVLDPESSEGLKLEPFFNIQSSSENEEATCYFYNKVVKAKHRHISYHYGKRPEYTKFADNVAILLKALRTSSNQDNFLEINEFEASEENFDGDTELEDAVMNMEEMS